MTTRTAMQLLPYIAPSQAQKHVTYNSAIKLLDVLVQTSAGSRFLTAPPIGAVAGDSYIVGDGATGDWLGQDRNLTVFTGDFWDFYVPKTGWRVWVEAEGAEAVFDGTDWTTSADRPERVAALGVSADADDINRLTVSSDASLFDNAGAGHQVKVNKAAAGNTASLLFQTGYSGRAEMGTVGSDAFTIKVSPDGTTFLTGMTIEPATGKVVAAHGINIAPAAGDPASPQDGDIWYNATTGKLRVRQDGVTQDMLSVLTGLMDLTSAQTVTGAKTFSGAVTFAGAQTIIDSGLTLQDDADSTKKAQFDLSGLTTGTTRTLNVPDANGTLALDSLFGAASKGLTPASGGGTANFLRADGVWALPPGGGSSYPALTSVPPAIDAIDGLTPVADGLAYYTGASSAALTTLSTYGRSLIDDGDAASARTTLERQDFATRAALVAWASGKTPATGLVMRAAGFATVTRVLARRSATCRAGCRTARPRRCIGGRTMPAPATRSLPSRR